MYDMRVTFLCNGLWAAQVEVNCITAVLHVSRCSQERLRIVGTELQRVWSGTAHKLHMYNVHVHVTIVMYMYCNVNLNYLMEECGHKFLDIQ